MGPLTTTRPCEGAMLSSVPVAACGPFCLSQACVARPLLCPRDHWAIGLRVAFAVRVSRASPLPPSPVATTSRSWERGEHCEHRLPPIPVGEVGFSLSAQRRRT